MAKMRVDATPFAEASESAVKSEREPPENSAALRTGRPLSGHFQRLGRG